MQGNKEPVKLFTIDVDSSVIKLDTQIPYLTLKEQKLQRIRERLQRDNMRSAAFNNDMQISDCFDNLAEIKAMRAPFGKEWYMTYNTAFNNFVKG
mgnify:CR=1 FL=1